MASLMRLQIQNFKYKRRKLHPLTLSTCGENSLNIFIYIIYICLLHVSNTKMQIMILQTQTLDIKEENCTLSTGGENSLNILLVPGNVPRPQTYVTTETPIWYFSEVPINICIKIDIKDDRQTLSHISRVLPRFWYIRECFHNPPWWLEERW